MSEKKTRVLLVDDGPSAARLALALAGISLGALPLGMPEVTAADAPTGEDRRRIEAAA